jgi:hypothetical protein
MRSTVLTLDALIYVSSLVLFISAWQGSRSKRTQVWSDGSLDYREEAD